MYCPDTSCTKKLSGHASRHAPSSRKGVEPADEHVIHAASPADVHVSQLGSHASQLEVLPSFHCLNDVQSATHDAGAFANG